PSFEYSKVKAVTSSGDSEILIMASSLVKDVLKKGRYADFKILDTMLGEDLTTLEYEHPLADQIPKQACFKHNVYLADFVTAENT
ncbi:MAG TPA: hypothetical protein PKC27_01510, partial [Methanomethylovorans sp.]|nr:hypothetical protein [Methanomethylovorans sp.]